MKNIFTYDKLIADLRQFFREERGFVEVPAQARKSILAACEDPKTISQYIFSGENWPLPQTGQMWLEHELLKNPEVKGVFCVTTSYRNEPFPIEGRHDKIFPMFEFESHGDLKDLIQLEADLLTHLGFLDNPEALKEISYKKACDLVKACDLLKKDILDEDDEIALQYQLGNHIALTKFPQRTHPFWNMKKLEDDLYSKVDVLMYGMETIGSAERSCDVDEMRENFYSISDGEYAKLLFNAFGEGRVTKELEEYFSLDMFPRFGGGIGVTRLARARKLLAQSLVQQ